MSVQEGSVTYATFQDSQLSQLLNFHELKNITVWNTLNPAPLFYAHFLIFIFQV
jgi:hypothetical protein